MLEVKLSHLAPSRIVPLANNENSQMVFLNKKCDSIWLDSHITSELMPLWEEGQTNSSSRGTSPFWLHPFSLHHSPSHCIHFYSHVFAWEEKNIETDKWVEVHVCQRKIIAVGKNGRAEFYSKSGLKDDNQFQQLGVWNIGCVTLSLSYPHHHAHSSYLNFMSDSP